MRRVLIVSHPAVLAVNQLPYAELSALGWDPFLVVPATWRNEFRRASFSHETLPSLRGRVVGRPAVPRGRQQRHGYLTSLKCLIDEVAPDVAFVEAEPSSVVAAQWGRALHRRAVPYGLASAENLDRGLPLAARVLQRWSLAHVAFVAARSPTAAARVRGHHPRIPTPIVAHHVPGWGRVDRREDPRFVIGYAGRLVPQKGLDTLVDGAAGIAGAVVVVVGAGPLQGAMTARAAARGVDLEIDSTVPHDEMASAYARFDVLVLPSLTTPTWAEQFGRVLVEAMSCGVPVIGSDSGEIPWVIESTGGGVVVPENDVAALRRAILELRDQPLRRRELGERGRAAVKEQFSVDAAAQSLAGALEAAVR